MGTPPNLQQKRFVPSGPLFKSHKVEGKSIRISFNHTGSGLMVEKKPRLAPTQELKNGKLEHFSISGKDNKWYRADARIDGNTVIVESNEVSEPVAVRYGFTNNPAKANLYNKEGLPQGHSAPTPTKFPSKKIKITFLPFFH